MKQIISVALFFILICGCENNSTPYFIKGKPYEKVYKALSKKYDLVYERSMNETQPQVDTKSLVVFCIKDSGNEADYLKVRGIINTELYKKEADAYMTEWDYENMKVRLFFSTNTDLRVMFIDKE